MLNIKEKLRELENSYTQLNKDYISRTSRKDFLEKRKEKVQALIDTYKIDELEKTNVILQKMSEQQREAAKTRLEELGTYALQYALSDDYEMRISIKEIRKKPNADVFIYKKSNGTLTDPIENNGGGIVDIISMALRLVTMQVYEPTIDGPIIMDEPFKMVSKEFIPMLSEFIKNIGEDFGRQIILVTHNEFLTQMADKRICVILNDNNESIIEEK
jgi:DNA repair exonuclease SbcCD ATPase subunit